MHLQFESFKCLTNENIKLRRELLLWYKDRVNYQHYFDIVDAIDNYMHRFSEKITDIESFKLSILLICDGKFTAKMFLPDEETERKLSNFRTQIIKDMNMSFGRETAYTFIIRKCNYSENAIKLCVELSLDYKILHEDPKVWIINVIDYINSNGCFEYIKDVRHVYLIKLNDNKCVDFFNKRYTTTSENIYRCEYQEKSVVIKMLNSVKGISIDSIDVREVSLLLQCKHNNIINLECYFIENCDIGLVFDDIRTEFDMNKALADNYIKQLLSAVNYLHDNGIVHADIKPENIMIKNGVIKLIDFGLSFRYFKNIKNRVGLKATTCFIIPVDVLMGNEDYGYDLDIWGCGVCIYYVLTDEFPFYYYISDITERRCLREIFKVLGSPTIDECEKLPSKEQFPNYNFIGFKNIDSKYADILYKIFKYIGKERPSAKEVLEMLN